MTARLLRVDVALRVIAVWAAALLVPGLIFGPLLIVIAILSVPLLILAAVVSVWFGASIARNPILWSLAAVAGSTLFGCAFFGRAGLLALAINVPAALLFLTSLRLLPFKIKEA